LSSPVGSSSTISVVEAPPLAVAAPPVLAPPEAQAASSVALSAVESVAESVAESVLFIRFMAVTFTPCVRTERPRFSADVRRWKCKKLRSRIVDVATCRMGCTVDPG
jgi:hypothetical protein